MQFHFASRSLTSIRSICFCRHQSQAWRVASIGRLVNMNVSGSAQPPDHFAAVSSLMSDSVFGQGASGGIRTWSNQAIVIPSSANVYSNRASPISDDLNRKSPQYRPSFVVMYILTHSCPLHRKFAQNDARILLQGYKFAWNTSYSYLCRAWVVDARLAYITEPTQGFPPAKGSCKEI